MDASKSVRLYFLLTCFVALFSTGCDQSTSGNEPIDRHSHLVFTRHAKCRMDCRHITEQEISEIIQTGNINYAKSEPNSRPDPKYALEGYSKEGQHLRIVVAPQGETLIVITCIELGVEWECHCN
ncbi:MAG: hypothetical protein C5B59_13230 [Bacteroidetes bacterium]|nr:MAG: hypothetical protein C5B59_13230 [Bacteroidota bacterium]